MPNVAEITVYFKYNNPVQNQINTMHLENKQGWTYISCQLYLKQNSD